MSSTVIEKKKFHFLVVDDSRISRKVEIESIRQEALSIRSDAEIEFVQCEDGVDAVNAVMNSGDVFYDAIFMDNVMIIMNGLEATRNIRSLGYRGTIIAVSGNVLKDDVNAFLEAGADYFVGKPLERSRIHEALHEILCCSLHE